MSTKLTNLVVLGMLTYLTEGKLHLEDITGSVPISLKDTVNIMISPTLIMQIKISLTVFCKLILFSLEFPWWAIY